MAAPVPEGLMVQPTDVSPALVTSAVNWSDSPLCRIADGGLIPIATDGIKVITAVADLLGSAWLVAVTITYWDADPLLLGTPGGTVDLRTGKIRAAEKREASGKK